jgi:hypothetical protein
VPGERYILDICENYCYCCDSRVASWTGECADEEVTEIHPRGAGTGYDCCSKSYGFDGKSSRGRHIERSD